MVNLLRHPLIKQAYDVMQAIEVCEASENLTKAVILAGELMNNIDKFLDCYDQDKRNCRGVDLEDTVKKFKTLPADWKPNKEVSDVPYKEKP